MLLKAAYLPIVIVVTWSAIRGIIIIVVLGAVIVWVSIVIVVIVVTGSVSAILFAVPIFAIGIGG